ncbi:MAG: M56 family metallopeptidase [Novosphingobium sp.]
MSWLVDTLLVTGGLIALVLVLRRPVSRTFGPATAYALWSLPLLRLIIPPITLPSAPAEAAPVLVTVLADPVPATAAPAAVWTFAPLFQTVWLAGALAYLGWRVWQYRVMRRTLLAGAIGVGEAEGVRLIEAPEVRSPVAFGLRDRVVCAAFWLHGLDAAARA